MFIWKKEFELGIPSIDLQHKKLFEIGNEINDLLSAHNDSDHDYDTVLTVIEKLKDYTVYHFNTEEELFLKYNYAEYDQHKKEHDVFIQYLNSINLGNVDENQKAFLKKLLNMIINWVLKHIISTDYMYKDFLIKLGSK